MNVIFFHIPKNAGTTVRKAFDIDDEPGHRIRENKFEYGEDGLFFCAGVRNYEEALDMMTPGFLDRAFTFCVVRNPYSRAVSVWRFLCIRDPEHDLSTPTFLEYSRKVREGNHPELLTRLQQYWLDGFNHNYIARLENLVDDLRSVMRMIGIAARTIEIGHENSSGHSNYEEYYCPESRRNIYKAYHVDFNNLGYQG